MTTYRLFTLDRTARFIVDVLEIDADDDAEALQTAETMLAEGPVEVWQSIRRVALLKRPCSMNATRAPRPATKSPAEAGQSVGTEAPERGERSGTVNGASRSRA